MLKHYFLVFFISLLSLNSLFCNEDFLHEKHGNAIKSQILIMLGEVDIKFKNRVEEQIADLRVGSDEADVLLDIMQLVADKPSALRDILKGAHVHVNDQGFLFSKWETLPSVRDRISSHPGIIDVEQYGISGPICHEVLFGIVEVKGELLTFFQFENTPWSAGWRNRIGHTLDAVNYLLKNLNIGPYGNSFYVDHSPLML